MAALSSAVVTAVDFRRGTVDLRLFLCVGSYGGVCVVTLGMQGCVATSQALASLISNVFRGSMPHEQTDG